MRYGLMIGSLFVGTAYSMVDTAYQQMGGGMIQSTPKQMRRSFQQPVLTKTRQQTAPIETVTALPIPTAPSAEVSATVVPLPPAAQPTPTEVIPETLPEFQPSTVSPKPEGALKPQPVEEPIGEIQPLTKTTQPSERPLPPIPTERPLPPTPAGRPLPPIPTRPLPPIPERPLPPIPTEQPTVPEFEPLPPPTEEELSGMVPPPVPPLSAPEVSQGPEGRARQTLLEEIQAGKQLKPVRPLPPAPAPTPTTERGKFLEEIQKGKTLKPVAPSEKREYRSDIYKLFEGEKAGRAFEVAREKELEKARETAESQDWSEWQ